MFVKLATPGLTVTMTYNNNVLYVDHEWTGTMSCFPVRFLPRVCPQVVTVLLSGVLMGLLATTTAATSLWTWPPHGWKQRSVDVCWFKGPIQWKIHLICGCFTWVCLNSFSVSLSLCVSVSVSLCVCVCFSVCLRLCLSVCLSLARTYGGEHISRIEIQDTRPPPPDRQTARWALASRQLRTNHRHRIICLWYKHVHCPRTVRVPLPCKQSMCPCFRNQRSSALGLCSSKRENTQHAVCSTCLSGRSYLARGEKSITPAARVTQYLPLIIM